MHVLSRQFLFKPASLQQLWTTIQLLHSITASLKPRRTCVLERDQVQPLQSTEPSSLNILQDWIVDYRANINSPPSCVNEWNEMPDILVEQK